MRFSPSRETMLGKAGAKQELFMTDSCEDLDLSEIKEVLDVQYLPPNLEEWSKTPKKGSKTGNSHVVDWLVNNSKQPNKFFYQKR